jgi:hypothetical protein
MSNLSKEPAREPMTLDKARELYRDALKQAAYEWSQMKRAHTSWQELAESQQKIRFDTDLAKLVYDEHLQKQQEQDAKDAAIRADSFTKSSVEAAQTQTKLAGTTMVLIGFQTLIFLGQLWAMFHPVR